MTGNPNFPAYLNIHPSSPPRKTDVNSFGDNSDHARESAFDSRSQETAIRLYGIAGRVWEAAYLLTQYLCHPSTSYMEFDPPCSLFTVARPLCAIELGSGTGFVGINLARNLFSSEDDSTCDDSVILTDLPDVCQLLTDNALKESRNWPSISTASSRKSGNLVVHPLPWGDHEAAQSLAHVLNPASRGRDDNLPKYVTHVICSDLVYFPHLLAPLLRSLISITSPPFVSNSNSPEVIISYEYVVLLKRPHFGQLLASGSPSDLSYLDMLPHWATRNQLLPKCSGALSGDALDHIYESYAWTVPDDDLNLLKGVGSLGNSFEKGDDTFESLLLMSMDPDQ